MTGGAGYFGSVLVPVLLGQGHEVRVLDRLLGGGHGLLPCCGHRNFEIGVGTINDGGTMSSALRDVDAVVHLAAIVGTPACDLDPAGAVSTNIDGTGELLQHRSHGIPLILASTGSVYGEVLSGECDESTEAQPTTVYGRTKLVSEELALGQGNATVLRFATAFGVSNLMRKDLLVNSLTRQSCSTGEISLYQPNAIRAFLHVSDMASAVALALSDQRSFRDQIYNVGDSHMVYSKRSLCDEIVRQTGARITAGCGFDPDLRDYTMSFDKIARRGFGAHTTLAAGVAELRKAYWLVG